MIQKHFFVTSCINPATESSGMCHIARCRNTTCLLQCRLPSQGYGMSGNISCHQWEYRSACHTNLSPMRPHTGTMKHQFHPIQQDEITRPSPNEAPSQAAIWIHHRILNSFFWCLALTWSKLLDWSFVQFRQKNWDKHVHKSRFLPFLYGAQEDDIRWKS
jgi:hypothetical protein